MRYLGSKKRIAREILPIVLADRAPGQYYVEPFMGGCNVIEHVANPRIAADIDTHLVELFKAVRDGWTPPDKISEREYYLARGGWLEDHLTGFVLFGCSFGGKKNGGYARNAYDCETRSTCLESKRSLLKQAPKLQGIEFRCSSYTDLEIPPSSIVYCDPPYQNTTTYKTGTHHKEIVFDHSTFWEWCEGMSLCGHRVFVSEYNAPANWTVVWEKPIVQQVSARTIATEKLFTRR